MRQLPGVNLSPVSRPSTASSRPTHRVLLVNVATQIGLTAIRELGKHGVDVFCLAADAHSIGLYSRYCRGGAVRAKGEEAFVAQVKVWAAELSPCAVMAISENDICLLNRNREQLSGVNLLIPEAAKMDIVLDKTRTRELAIEAGIAVPRAWAIRSLDELYCLRRELTFPVVLKWANPLSVLPMLRRIGLQLDKFRYCQRWEELVEYMRQFTDVRVFPTISEYCPGHGLGQSFFMWQGRPLLQFQHRRLHEWPPEGGFSTLCQGIDGSQHEELAQKSVALLKRIGWEGAAMVEYRYDPRSDRAWLMEINGRLWGSLPLAHHSGAEFAWLTYAVLAERKPNVLCTVRADVRCRALVPETKRLLRILFAQNKIQDRARRFSRVREFLQYVVLFINPRTRYYVFSLDDPKPAFADLWFAAVGRLNRAGFPGELVT
jgi:predicted ATP-grasp superfamily ATP-dependent carboligase